MLSCVITSGGSGNRFDKANPKHFYKINGKMVLQHTIEVFREICNIVVTIRKEDEEFFKENFKNINYVIGAESRQSSVFNGLKFFEDKMPTHVLITDSARPFVSQNLILKIKEELESGEVCVIPGVPVQDTVKRIINGFVVETINRSGLFYIQTPQGFEYKTILNLHKEFEGLDLTDDSALCEKKGIKIKMIEGEKKNVKITTKEDVMGI